MNFTSWVPTALKFVGAIILTVTLIGVGFLVTKNMTKAGASIGENAFEAAFGTKVDFGVDKNKATGNSDLDNMGGQGLGDLSGFGFN